MSRDDVILVARKTLNHKRIYYVFHANATDHWEDDNWECFITPEAKYTYSRAIALITAHDLQKNLLTEYGVREVF
jgi:hypothetical protein